MNFLLILRVLGVLGGEAVLFLCGLCVLRGEAFLFLRGLGVLGGKALRQSALTPSPPV
jgi:hypothetical protein